MGPDDFQQVQDSFVSQEVWDGIWANAQFSVAPKEDPVRQWIEAHFRGRSGTCLELGCFPGRYLSVFGELGYELHGLDLTPRVEMDCKRWLVDRGYKVGEISRGDVFSHRFDRQYDVVCSFGLIEHFGEWAKLLALQAELVADGGCIVVETPNFRGWIQQMLHRCLDSENLKQHNLEAMVPNRWARELESRHFQIIERGHFGTFDFWTGTQPRGTLARKTVNLICKVNRRLSSVWRNLPAGVAAYAPYCGLVARKMGLSPAGTLSSLPR
jgi:SAM-dependent methyltransferase